jgi:hypothetical protein
MLGISITNGMPVLQLTGANNYTYLIQSSTNLVNWTPMALLVNTNGMSQFMDSPVTNSHARFYRAMPWSANSSNSSVTVFSDNFTGSTIDPTKWTTSGSTVTESGGMMQVLTTVTDQGGVLTSVPIPINQHGDITITRSVLLHYANQYFAGRMNLQFGGLGAAGIYYANYIWAGNPSYGWEDRYGFYILRNNAYIINQSADTDLAGPFTPLWDAWFREKIIYSPDTGNFQYFTNDTLVADYNIGVMPPTNNPTLQLNFTAWGWYTGHEQLMQNLVISQQSQ